MLVARLILTIATLTPLVSAFYPWFPCYRYVEGTCPSSKGRAEGSSERRGDDAVKVIQRVPKNGLPRDVQITRLADRLARKYQRGAAVQVSQVEEPSRVEKRGNAYTIYPAPTPTQANSAGIDQDGTDYSYFAQIGFGSANTLMYMLLDTGADTSWVMGSACTSDPCKIHNLFGASNSDTLKTLPTSFSIQYGSGSVSGMLATDSMSFAGMNLAMTFGLANVTSSDFNSFPIDGILGLSLAKSSTPSFVDTLVTSKSLKSNIFGISLNREADGTNTGEINFGAPDTSRYTGSLNYMSVNTSQTGGDWAIAMDNVGFGTSQAGISGKLAYIDTGTSFIFCPPADAAIFHALIPGAKSSDGVTYYAPCSATASVTFTFGGTTYSVSSKDWLSPPANGQCTSNIYGRAVVPGSWLVGDTFLKNVYAVFDIDKTRVGLAPTVVVTSSSGASTSASTATYTDASVSPGSPTLATTLPSIATGGSSASGTSAASLGLNGHETSAVGTAAAETASPSATTTPQKSDAKQLTLILTATLLTLLVAVANLT